MSETGFHMPITYYSVYNKTAKKKLEIDEFYAQALRNNFGNFDLSNMDATAEKVSILMGEALWYKSQRPYYRVFPDYVEIFADTELDIPLKYLALPYPAFKILLPRGMPAIDGKIWHSISVFSVSQRDANWLAAAGARPLIPLADQVEGLKVEMPELYAAVDKSKLAGSEADIFTVLSERYPVNKPEATQFFAQTGMLSLFQYVDESYTLENYLTEAFESHQQCGAAYPESVRAANWAITERTWRILLSVCFLATGQDKLIDPDVLNKDFSKYLDAVNQQSDRKQADKARERIEELVQKARDRRGEQMTGFTIGRREALLGWRPPAAKESGGETGVSRELLTQHQRKAHFQLFHTGPGRTVPVVKFVRQVTVRPDLPLNEAPLAYRTLKQKT